MTLVSTKQLLKKHKKKDMQFQLLMSGIWILFKLLYVELKN